MVEVRPPAKIVAVVTIATLHVSRPAPLGNNAAAVMALDRDSVAAAQIVMDVHAALGVMHVADLAVGAGTNRAAALGDVLTAALGRGTALDRCGVRTARTGVCAARTGVRASGCRSVYAGRWSMRRSSPSGGRPMRGSPTPAVG